MSQPHQDGKVLGGPGGLTNAPTLSGDAGPGAHPPNTNPFVLRLSRLQVGGVRYNSPMTQVVLVGFVALCTVGMFSAISNLGAGGSQDVSLVDTTNGVLYGFFAVTGIFAGAVTNLLGIRPTLFIGAFGYMVYVAGLWVHQTTNNRGFLIASGAILGICAALLWSAQGSIMMSYPLEQDKGKAFGVFWAVFQLGSVLGAAIATGKSAHSMLPGVATGVYLAFIIVMAVGWISSWLILPPNYIVRSDQTLVKVEARSSPKQEVQGMLYTLKSWKMLLLTPMFFGSNWFYAYQGSVNAHRFNGRTRALNALLEGFGAIIGALFIGICCLDLRILGRRRTRGLIGLTIMTVFVMATWISALVWQTGFTRDETRLYDWDDSDYAPLGALYFFFYFSDAQYQAMAYWIMAALTNDPWTLARYAGFYKAIQSAGAAGSFGMDAVNTPFLNEILSSWLLMVVSIPLAGIVIWTIKDTNYEAEETVHVGDGAVGDPSDPEVAKDAVYPSEKA